MTDSHFKIEKLNLLIFIPSFYSVLFKAGLMRLSEGLKKRSHSLKLSQIGCDQFPLNQLETILVFFATIVLNSAIVQQILRWDMALLEQLPWYQEIFSKGEERGRKEELYSGIELALKIKFGNQGSELMPIISQITDLQKLKAIQQAIKTVNTVNELQQVLSTNFT